MTLKYKEIRSSETQNTRRHEVEPERQREFTHSHYLMNQYMLQVSAVLRNQHSTRKTKRAHTCSLSNESVYAEVSAVVRIQHSIVT